MRCCGSRFRRFEALGEPNRACWSCGSLERERLMWLYLDRHPELLRPGMKVLHVAPEGPLAPRIAASRTWTTWRATSTRASRTAGST
jgi:hypothetical protein